MWKTKRHAYKAQHLLIRVPKGENVRSILGDNASEVLELMKDINLIYTYHRASAEHQKQIEDLQSIQRRAIG